MDRRRQLDPDSSPNGASSSLMVLGAGAFAVLVLAALAGEGWFDRIGFGAGTEWSTSPRTSFCAVQRTNEEPDAT